MSQDEAIKILKTMCTDNFCIEQLKIKQAIETILDLYQKTKYELEGKECVIDTMAHNEEVLTRNYEILETKLQQEREKNKELEKENERLKYLLTESGKIIDEYTNELENDTKKIIEYREKYLEKRIKNDK